MTFNAKEQLLDIADKLSYIKDITAELFIKLDYVDVVDSNPLYEMDRKMYAPKVPNYAGAVIYNLTEIVKKYDEVIKCLRAISINCYECNEKNDYLRTRINA